MSRDPLSAIRDAVKAVKKVCEEKTLASIDATVRKLTSLVSSLDDSWVKPLCPSPSKRAAEIRKRILLLKSRLQRCLQVTRDTLLSCAEALDAVTGELEGLARDVEEVSKAFDLARTVYESIGTVDVRDWVKKLTQYLSSPVSAIISSSEDKVSVTIREPQVSIAVPQELSCLPDALVEAVLREAGREAPLLLRALAGSLSKCIDGTPNVDDILACAFIASGSAAGAYAKGHLVVTIHSGVAEKLESRLVELLGSDYTGSVTGKGGEIRASPTIHYDIAASPGGEATIVLRDTPPALAATDTRPLISAAATAYNSVAEALSKNAEKLKDLEAEYAKLVEEYGSESGGVLTLSARSIAARLLEKGEKIDVLLSRIRRIEEEARRVLDAIRKVQETEQQ